MTLHKLWSCSKYVWDKTKNKVFIYKQYKYKHILQKEKQEIQFY